MMVLLTKYQWPDTILCLHLLHINGLLQDSCNSIANAMELLQSYKKPSISLKPMMIYYELDPSGANPVKFD